MLKILKLDENGEPIKNEDGTYVIEDFNLDEVINNAIEEYKTTQSEEETKKAEEEAAARAVLEETEKKERIDYLEKELAILKEQVKRTSGTGPVIETNESEQNSSNNETENVSMGFDPQSKTIIGG